MITQDLPGHLRGAQLAGTMYGLNTKVAQTLFRRRVSQAMLNLLEKWGRLAQMSDLSNEFNHLNF